MFALIQSLVPERMRAMSIALLFLCANLIGIGLGPLAVGALSDALRYWLRGIKDNAFWCIRPRHSITISTSWARCG